MRLEKAIYAAVGLGLADALTTYVALSRDFAETNPLFAGSPWAAVVANVAMAVVVPALSGAIVRAVRMLGVERHVAAMLAVFVAARVIVVASNVLILAGIIYTPLLPPFALFIPAIPTAALAILTVITAVKQVRFLARPHL